MTARSRLVLVAAAGFVAACVAVVGGGRAYTGTSTPPTRWLGLIGADGFDAGDSPLWGVLLWVGITGLSLAWLAALRLRPDVRQGWTLAGAWALPFVLGPPLVSKDVYAYAAQALMLRRGLDVYDGGPCRLLDGSLQLSPSGDGAGVLVYGGPGANVLRTVRAVDPRWQDSPSPYGPVTTLLLRGIGAVTGDPTHLVVLLRVVSVLGVAALVWLATRLAGARADTIVLLGANPLVLVHALSGAHVEAVMCALLVAAFVAGQRERYELAVLLACLAGLVKAPAFLAVPVLVLWHVLGEPLPWRERGLRVARDAGTAAVAIVVTSVVAPHGWGWLGNLDTPTRGDPTSSITGHVADLVGAETLVHAVGAVVAVLVVVWLLVTFRRRPLAVTTGYGLLTVAFLAPVAYPWYALWGVVCLLPSASGRVRVALLALCVAEAGLSIPGAPGVVSGPLAFGVVAVALLSVGYLNRPGRTVQV